MIVTREIRPKRRRGEERRKGKKQVRGGERR